VTDQELIAELQHEADHWARCATNCTNGIVKAAYTSRSDRIAAAAERIRVLGEAIDEIAKEEDGVYGFYLGGDPRKFCPDSDGCTPEELAAHKAACEKWDEAEAKGEKLEPDPCGSGWISPTVHVTRSAYGLGSYTFPTNAARLAQAARAATDAARGGSR